MKPKHSIFCRDAGRSKLVFETEKKAWNFIRFNGQEILEESGKIPCRVYFCESCGGYHTSSRRNPNLIKSKTKDIIKAYHKDYSSEPVILSKEDLIEISDTLFKIEKILGPLLNEKKKDHSVFLREMNEAETLLKKVQRFPGNVKRRKKIQESIDKIKKKYKEED